MPLVTTVPIVPVTVIAECADTGQRASFLCWCQVMLLVSPAQMLKNGHASEPGPPVVLSSASYGAQGSVLRITCKHITS